VQSYERVASGNIRPVRPSFREGGVYLITGGLGSIGIAISEHLAEKYKARLVLVGRSPLPERKSWDAWITNHPADDPVCAKVRAIRKIESLGGEVLYLNANVADGSAMREVIQQTRKRFGDLHGVIHGAGIVGDAGYREIKESDAGSCEDHFQAKARGLIVLEDVLDGEALDFCLLMSSLTSVLGGIGQAAYASANLHLDAFARRHNRTSRVPWLSVNWDVWRLGNHTAAGAGPGGTLKELGMSVAEAMEMLETTLSMKAAGQLVVSTGDLESRINQWIKLESLRDRGGSTARSPARRPGAKSNSDAPRDEIEQQIAQAWQEALGMDTVGIHENFSQLGGHSLLAIRIVSELRNAFQIDLPVRALFDAPTVAELSSHIKERLVADIEALSDEEARQLVTSG
jgi:NAD(P)-dependent dehydrogenase (short-subunit alcohol dehydrogenase family)/acyl carrier protein